MSDSIIRHILIADAGSTKTDWVLLGGNRESIRRFTTDGLNALLASELQIRNLFADVRAIIGEDVRICEAYYYGAGCATPQICAAVERLLRETLGADYASVTSDLLGAARSLLGDNEGIACILGTGSNSCLYDGTAIVSNIPSLGFILGDEGSGAALGKRLVSDAFKGHLPDIIREKFLDTYRLTLPEILDRVYRQPAPNRFLASLVPFLHENLWAPYIYSLVLKELTQFMKRNVAMYPHVQSLPLGFTGSIAFNFASILKEAAASQGFGIGSITQSPIQGLIDFHAR